MLYATDTHSLVHFSTGKRQKLGKDARRVFQEAEHGRARIVIPVTCWRRFYASVKIAGFVWTCLFLSWLSTSSENQVRFSSRTTPWIFSSRWLSSLPFVIPSIGSLWQRLTP